MPLHLYSRNSHSFIPFSAITPQPCPGKQMMFTGKQLESHARTNACLQQEVSRDKAAVETTNVASQVSQDSKRAVSGLCEYN